MIVLFIVWSSVYTSGLLIPPKLNQISLGSHKLRFDDACDDVCKDLPSDDRQPVCMMFSRYKRGYQFFVNLCHAKRAICKENMALHMVHPSRCMKSNQFFMPVN